MWEANDSTTESLGNVPQLLSQAARQPCLLVMTGPDKGAVHLLSVGQRTLGRSPTHADIVISGRGLSRAHARIVLTEDERLEVVDLESTNGVFVNGDKVKQAYISDGDLLALGPEVQLRLEFPDPTLQQLIKDMHEGATRDALTGALNRRAFMERLEQEHCASSRHRLALSLVMIDVDHFKSVNDKYGHPAGDAVLIEVARRINEGVRVEDVVARYGGEEFILMMRQTPIDGALILVDRLRARVCEKPFLVPVGDETQEIAVTFSAGVTQAAIEESVEDAIAAADKALYEAKKSGRNRVCRS